MYCRTCGKAIAENAEICVNFASSNLQFASGNTNLSLLTKQTITEYAGFWRRLVAFIIDSFLLYIAGSIIFGKFFLPLIFFKKLFPFGLNKFFFSYIVLGWVYYALMESSVKQATLGKMVLGIIVTDLEGKRISFARATGRHFAKIISGIILYIGFIMAGFTDKKQALHDIIADSLVVKRYK
uniref:RDD family protein n=1 Tax=candidate division WOR-3 bacterium TaxID=2052148 RepID=A0A7C6AA08_UNCW3